MFDPSLYFKDDINTLRNTLQRFIPNIKYFNLNYNEFLTKVYPYRRDFIKRFRESLINHFKPIRNPKPKITKEIRPVSSIDSKIITVQYAELISRWIDKLRVTDKTKNVYEFNLILRGTLKDSDEILGGYNSETWKSNFSDRNTNDSLIFSFRNKESIKDYILSRADDERNAI
ncbi:carbohydrate-binding module family 13 protein [Rhizophagus irregularis DAOM 181602=DAOM 197198]|nr:carbohydrate-binding module family 13 protein [Rhizophagus irregularis DAOM 181602=DAOM 197198]